MKRHYEGEKIYEPVEGRQCMRCGYNSTEWFETCPDCKSENIEDIFYCGACGNPVDMFYHWDFGGMCQKCFEDEVTHWNQAAEYGGSFARTSVEINGLYASAFTPDQIDEILAAAFTQLPENDRRKKELEFVNDDPSTFVEWLGGMYDEEEEA